MSKGTTEVGYTNKHNQRVLRKTNDAGSDHLQYIYVLKCLMCGNEYGANGSDIWQRRCPRHDTGAPGLTVDG